MCSRAAALVKLISTMSSEKLCVDYPWPRLSVGWKMEDGNKKKRFTDFLRKIWVRFFLFYGESLTLVFLICSPFSLSLLICVLFHRLHTHNTTFSIWPRPFIWAQSWYLSNELSIYRVCECEGRYHYSHKGITGALFGHKAEKEQKKKQEVDD